MRAALLLCLLILLLSGLCEAASMAASPGPAGPAQAYDLIVLVYAPEAGPAQVALGYASMVDHKALQEGLSDLAQRTGAKLSGLRLADQPQEPGSKTLTTGAQFSAQGLLPAQTGALPVGAFLHSLPDWQHLRLIFMVGESFQFTGPMSAEVDGFSVRLVNAMKPYEYDVERKNRSGPSPTLAVASRPPKAQPQPWLPAVLIGLPVGVFFGWLVGARKLAAREPHRLLPKAPDAPKGDEPDGT